MPWRSMPRSWTWYLKSHMWRAEEGRSSRINEGLWEPSLAWGSLTGVQGWREKLWSVTAAWLRAKLKTRQKYPVMGLQLPEAQRGRRWMSRRACAVPRVGGSWCCSVGSDDAHWCSLWCSCHGKWMHGASHGRWGWSELYPAWCLRE